MKERQARLSACSFLHIKHTLMVIEQLHCIGFRQDDDDAAKQCYVVFAFRVFSKLAFGMTRLKITPKMNSEEHLI